MARVPPPASASSAGPCRLGAAAAGPPGATSGWAPCCRLAGLEVFSRRRLSLAGDRLAADGRVELELARRLPGGAGWWPAPAGGGQRPAMVRADGRRIVVASGAARDELLAASLGRCLPAASLLQGRGVLHAAAVAAGGEVFALVGASGAGKSTLGRALAAWGLAPVSDDLLPCRPAGERVFAPAGEDAVGSGFTGRLAALLFLERRAGARRPALQPLGRRETVVELTRHGFGDLPSPRLWRRQLDFHLALARTVPAFRARLPEGLRRLPDVARWLAEAMRGGRLAVGDRRTALPAA